MVCAITIVALALCSMTVYGRHPQHLKHPHHHQHHHHEILSAFSDNSDHNDKVIKGKLERRENLGVMNETEMDVNIKRDGDGKPKAKASDQKNEANKTPAKPTENQAPAKPSDQKSGAKSSAKQSTGDKDTESKKAGSQDTESKKAGSQDTESKKAGSQDTESKKAGSEDTGKQETGSEDSGSSESDNNKLKKDATDIKTEIGKLNVAEFTGTSMAKVKGGVDAALKGVDDFYDNYKKKDNLGMVISGISILSGIASVIGGPIGLIVSMSLNILTTGLGILKKEKKKPEESESEKLEKVIKRALKEFRETGLKAEWSGYERMADLYLKNVEFVGAFNAVEGDKIKMEDLGGLPKVKQTMFEIVTPQIYEVLMASSHLLGKVEFEISQICDSEAQMNKVKAKKKKKPNDEHEDLTTEEEEEEYEKVAKSCLDIYELYSKINFYRESTYLKSLDIINKVMNKELPEWFLSFNKEKTDEAKRKGFVYMELLLDVIQHSNEQNKKIFNPLMNPFNNHKMRYTINYYQTYINKYEYLSAYLDNLFVKNEESKKMILQDVMLCDQFTLLGSCYREVLTGDTEDLNFVSSKGRWRSVYVPEGKTIDVTYENTGGCPPLKLIGPGVMGSLFNIIGKEKPQEVNNPVTNIAISKSPDLTEDRVVHICVAPLSYKNLGNAVYHKSVCTTKNFRADSVKYPMDELKDRITWKGNYISIASDEPDLAFVGKAIITTTDRKVLKIRWGPFFSPQKMKQMCGSALWDEIQIYKYKDGESSTVKKRTDVELCKGNNNILCEEGIIDKSFFLTICKEPELKGDCEDIPLIRGKADKVVRLTRVNGYVEMDSVDKTHDVLELEKKNIKMINEMKFEDGKTTDHPFNEKIDSCIWLPRRVTHTLIKAEATVEKNLLASMKVPQGLSVELYTGTDGTGTMYGPYDGPVTVDRIDGNYLESNVINSIKIKEIPSV